MPNFPKTRRQAVSGPKTGEAVITSFFGLDPVGSAILAADFDVQEEVHILTRLMRDPDPAVALNAHSQFRSVLRDVAKANTVQVTGKQSNADGSSIESTARLIGQISRDQPDAESERHQFAAEFHPPVNFLEPAPEPAALKPDPAAPAAEASADQGGGPGGQDHVVGDGHVGATGPGGPG